MQKIFSLQDIEMFVFHSPLLTDRVLNSQCMQETLSKVRYLKKIIKTLLKSYLDFFFLSTPFFMDEIMN